MPLIPWRRLEAALERIARAEYTLDRSGDTGDLYAQIDSTTVAINLTELAKLISDDLLFRF